MISPRWCKITVSSLTILVLGLVIGLYLPVDQPSSGSLKECRKKYRLIDNRTVCGRPNDPNFDLVKATRQEILTLITKKRGEGSLVEAAVQFQDLANSAYFNINEFADFVPASLLKLPLATSLFRCAEDEPNIFQQKITYSPSLQTITQQIKPEHGAVPGETYSVEELIRFMLVYSDNASYALLENFIASDPHHRLVRQETYRDLGIIDPQNQLAETIQTREYFLLFKNLYRSVYLQPESSEKILGWLSEFRINGGLAGGIPYDQAMANKYGERLIVSNNKTISQFHDCGIVYADDHPYLLCVMTKGRDINTLIEIVAEISKIVYDKVTNEGL